MLKLVDRLVNAMHWLDLFFPSTRKKIDWREIGQIRDRLDKSKIEKGSKSEYKTVYKAIDESAGESEKVLSSTEILSNGSSRLSVINTQSPGVQDKAALARWYARSNGIANEETLKQRPEEGKRSYEARQIRATFSLRKSDKTAQNEIVTYEVQRDHDKLASFLAGTTDDISDLIMDKLPIKSLADKVSNSQDNTDELKENDRDARFPVGLAAKFPFLSQSDIFGEQGKSALSTDLRTIAFLDDIVKLDSLPSSQQVVNTEEKEAARS